MDVAVTDGQRVVDDGPCRLVRHPSYSGSLLQFLGVGLSLGHWPARGVIFLPIFLVFLHRIQLEEVVLRTALGEPCATYAHSARRPMPTGLLMADLPDNRDGSAFQPANEKGAAHRATPC